jgi:hypothetical protein
VKSANLEGLKMARRKVVASGMTEDEEFISFHLFRTKDDPQPKIERQDFAVGKYQVATVGHFEKVDGEQLAIDLSKLREGKHVAQWLIERMEQMAKKSDGDLAAEFVTEMKRWGTRMFKDGDGLLIVNSDAECKSTFGDLCLNLRRFLKGFRVSKSDKQVENIAR